LRKKWCYLKGLPAKRRQALVFNSKEDAVRGIAF